MNNSEILKNIDKKLTSIIGLITLLIPGELLKKKNIKIELILKNSGFEIKEIAEILNKKYDAIQKTIERAKKK